MAVFCSAVHDRNTAQQHGRLPLYSSNEAIEILRKTLALTFHKVYNFNSPAVAVFRTMLPFRLVMTLNLTGILFCLSCYSMCACNETSLMRYLFSAYSVTKLQHVSGFLVAHHQEVKMYICNKWCV
jgi:hypothetical protein